MNFMLIDAFRYKDVREWERARYLAFHNYHSVRDFGGAPFKNLKNMKDLTPLWIDEEYKVVVDVEENKERALKAIENAKKVRQNIKRLKDGK